VRFLRSVLAIGLGLAACEGDHDPPQECDDLLDCVAIDLREAIDVATDEVPGIVVDAELSDEDGEGPMGPIYDVDVFTGDATREVSVDARTGEFLENGYDPDDQEDGPLQAAAIEGSAAGITILGAIDLGEQTADGTAVSAELELESNVIVVVAFHDEERRVVTISLETGDVNQQGG
jgi:uncharacterized membrane protein YkoI